ncbi:hypothetical protein X777_00513 [Ooceraea biroi]|uniref:DNA helicase Pif1-like 2B domain-containing protein n=1 Tax=Ooceraea biroi TaxID=2015173 RepID=A0A026VVW8_OOCBI|nr:hypothetical protein X777_00513 [Ooceraea biroi]
MLRRNIDVNLGLVNGTIGTIISIIRSAIDNKVRKNKDKNVIRNRAYYRTFKCQI